MAEGATLASLPAWADPLRPPGRGEALCWRGSVVAQGRCGACGQWRPGELPDDLWSAVALDTAKEERI